MLPSIKRGAQALNFVKIQLQYESWASGTRLKNYEPANEVKKYHTTNMSSIKKHCDTSVTHRTLIHANKILTLRRKFGNMVGPNDLEPVVDDIQKELTKRGLALDKGYTCYATLCPAGDQRLRVVPKKDDLQERLYVNFETGYFVCNKCGKCGPWRMLLENLDLIKAHVQNKRPKSRIECFDGLDHSEEGRQALKLYSQCQPVTELSDDTYQAVIDKLQLQGIQKETMDRFGVRITEDLASMVFPYFGNQQNQNNQRVLQGLRIWTLKEPGRKIFKRTIPKGQAFSSGIFVAENANGREKSIVLTGSEQNALSVSQETRHCVAALPKGYAALPQQILPLMEQYDQVTFWLGDDVKSWEASRLFSKKLNPSRCFVIRPSEDRLSPYKALQQRLKLSSILKHQKPVLHKSIVTFKDIRSDVYSEISQAEQVKGIKWKRYTVLNSLLKGHRRGELTILTGPTGSGKTTFISEYSLDLCMQGVNTLWGSFEINNARLLRTMLTQFAQCNLTKNLSQFHEVADRFEHLPMFFMTFHGEEQLSNVTATMSHAVYVHDIAHIIVDNLQFMMGLDSVTVADRFFRQDQMIGAFRKFASRHNCHVTLVIHPRKENSDDLTINSIFGGVKASQEADNILILQDKRLVSTRGRKYIEVAKNRYEGELGIMSLKFDRESMSFATKPKKENGQGETVKGQTEPVKA